MIQSKPILITICQIKSFENPPLLGANSIQVAIHTCRTYYSRTQLAHLSWGCNSPLFRTLGRNWQNTIFLVFIVLFTILHSKFYYFCGNFI